MNTFAVLLIVCGGTAVLALVLSLTTRGPVARQLAQVSLWLTLGGVPVALAIDIARLWLEADDAASSALLLGRTISRAMSYGALALPCAAIAGLALRRVAARRLK